MSCTAFEGLSCIGCGQLSQVAVKAREAWQRAGQPVLIFDDRTGQPVEIDFRGTIEDVLSRLSRVEQNEPPVADAGAGKAEIMSRGPGRPRLGVVAREITLLPRQWEWLNQQPGGASVALRKLVDEARKSNVERDIVRQSQEVAYRFMSALAGNLPGFEEASRALFACRKEKFEQIIAAWPPDVASYAGMLAENSFRQGACSK